MDSLCKRYYVYERRGKEVTVDRDKWMKIYNALIPSNGILDWNT